MRKELLAAVLDEAGPELMSDIEILDIGCGTGSWLETLQDARTDRGRLTGVDILPERVAAAAARVPAATVRHADARSLPFEDNRFAVAFLFTVLSSLSTADDVQRALAEGLRVVRPSGLLLVYEPRWPSPLNRSTRRISWRELRQAGMPPAHARPLTLFPPLARRLGRATERLYPRLARIPVLKSHRLVAFRRAPE
jgi:ubiquinone/menaquinone biosynthesis C-methylase UbiE